MKTNLPVLRLAFAPGGELLAAVEADFGLFGTISHLTLWNVLSESVVHTFDADRYGRSEPVFSPDGRNLAAGVGELVKVCDVESGRETHRFRAAGSTGTSSIAFSLDGETLAIGRKLWHLPTDSVETISIGEPFHYYPLGIGFLLWKIAVASVRQRRLNTTSVSVGVAWAAPAVAVLIALEMPWGTTTETIIIVTQCVLLGFGLVLAALRAQNVGLRGLFAGELLWASKGLCIATFLILLALRRASVVPLLLNLLSVFAVLSVFRIRADRRRGAPWQHWVGLAVSIVEPIVLLGLYAFVEFY